VVNTPRLRKRRERLWKQDPRCFYCGRVTVLKQCGRHETEPDNLATLEHLRSRLDAGRQEPNDGKATRTVLACRKCNNAKADVEVAALSAEELHRRSGRWPTIALPDEEG
jgi:5-methylcytosine-specific restriction endonuclease McrA